MLLLGINPRQSLETAEKQSTEEVQVLNEHLAELQNGQSQEAQKGVMIFTVKSKEHLGKATDGTFKGCAVSFGKLQFRVSPLQFPVAVAKQVRSPTK